MGTLPFIEIRGTAQDTVSESLGISPEKLDPYLSAWILRCSDFQGHHPLLSL